MKKVSLDLSDKNKAELQEIVAKGLTGGHVIELGHCYILVNSGVLNPLGSSRT